MLFGPVFMFEGALPLAASHHNHCFPSPPASPTTESSLLPPPQPQPRRQSTTASAFSNLMNASKSLQQVMASPSKAMSLPSPGMAEAIPPRTALSPPPELVIKSEQLPVSGARLLDADGKDVKEKGDEAQAIPVITHPCRRNKRVRDTDEDEEYAARGGSSKRRRFVHTPYTPDQPIPPLRSPPSPRRTHSPFFGGPGCTPQELHSREPPSPPCSHVALRRDVSSALQTRPPMLKHAACMGSSADSGMKPEQAAWTDKDEDNLVELVLRDSFLRSDKLLTYAQILGRDPRVIGEHWDSLVGNRRIGIVKGSPPEGPPNAGRASH